VTLWPANLHAPAALLEPAEAVRAAAAARATSALPLWRKAKQGASGEGTPGSGGGGGGGGGSGGGGSGGRKFLPGDRRPEAHAARHHAAHAPYVGRRKTDALFS